jgi:aspartate aminotransferase
MEYLNLASGVSHFASPEVAVSQTIAAFNHHKKPYSETEGLPALREALVNRYAEDYGVNVSKENILITSGAKQAVFNLLSVLLQSGDEVILPQPSWFAFPEMFDLLHLKPVYLETYAEDNYDLKPEKLEALITDRTRLFILTNPNNPSGRVYAEAEILALLKVLEKYPQVKILSDEIYDLLLYDNVKLPSILQFPEVREKAILVNGFTKNFAMSDWRIGYIIAPPDIYQKCLNFQQTIISGVNPFIQEGCVATLENRRDFLQKSLAELTVHRQILIDWLNKQDLVSGYIPQGGYYVFADFRKLLQSENCQQKNIKTSAEFFQHLKEKYKLEFQPGDRFERPGFARITFAVPKEKLKEALSRLDKLIVNC